MAADLLMAYTTEGSTRVGQIGTNALVFHVAQVAVGSGGYNVGTPNQSLPLVPAATSLTAEVLRQAIPTRNTTLDTVETPRGNETTYTTFSGLEVTGALGEAGLFAVVDNPGTTGLAVGYEFLLAQAHFPRVIMVASDKLVLRWPLRLRF